MQTSASSPPESSTKLDTKHLTVSSLVLRKETDTCRNAARTPYKQQSTCRNAARTPYEQQSTCRNAARTPYKQQSTCRNTARTPYKQQSTCRNAARTPYKQQSTCRNAARTPYCTYAMQTLLCKPQILLNGFADLVHHVSTGVQNEEASDSREVLSNDVHSASTRMQEALLETADKEIISRRLRELRF